MYVIMILKYKRDLTKISYITILKGKNDCGQYWLYNNTAIT